MINLFILLLVATNCLNGSEGKIKLSPEEELEIQNELKALNKPAVKSIYLRGDDHIYDCVDKNKQPAFDNPSLKNHIFKERPNKIAHAEDPLKANLLKSMLYEDEKDAGCPPGTVPIRRTTRKDLIKGKRLTKIQTNKYDVTDAKITPKGFAYVVGFSTLPKITSEGPAYNDLFYGSRARFNIWNPLLTAPNQYSSLKMVLQATQDCVTDTIEAGWIVYPDVYGDNRTRLSTSWKNGANGKGCFDNRCPGFVQVDYSIPLGLVLTSSETGVVLNDIEINIERDTDTKDWWLTVQSVDIGYWPNEIFGSLFFQPARRLMWVGETLKASPGTSAPQMGSGRDISEGLYHAAYISNVKVIDVEDGELKSLRQEDLQVLNSVSRECYALNGSMTLPRSNSFGFFVGGPGGTSC